VCSSDLIVTEIGSGRTDATRPTGGSLLLRMLQRGIRKQLSEISVGQIVFQYDGQTEIFGSDTASRLRATVTIHSPEFFQRVAVNGSLGFAESYLLGEWACDSLTDLIRIICRNLHVSDTADTGFVRLVKSVARRWHARHANSKTNSLGNIHAHYDLGNEFYSLFLDETMTYSCGIFLTDDASLKDAQIEKIDRICRKLDLQPDDHLVEIGTGWGALAIHASGQYGCRVTTTTISREQYEFAKQRVAEAGLGDRITLLLKDYRDLDGYFDKLVSCEMIEAVGHEYFDTFFDKCDKLLKPDGLMVLQGITMSEHRYQRYLKQVDFIQRYIFPGGCLITPQVVIESVTRSSDMRLIHLEDLAPHYARTLRTWRERFFARLQDVRELGFPEAFIRMWEYYLCYCEAAFTERLVGTVQMQFAKSECRTDALNAGRMHRGNSQGSAT
ncbi:MAG: cyclopropane-fatty-acyl-phospholipid synthase family protein, partial [Planctomycetaceae bacterium]